MSGAAAPVRYWAAANEPSSWRASLSFWVRLATSSRSVSTSLRCFAVFSLAALYFWVADSACR